MPGPHGQGSDPHRAGQTPFPAVARFNAEVLPVLRQRGLFRSDYEADTLRGNLGLAIPENVHTAARVTAEREHEAVTF